MRRSRVTCCLASSTQQMNSLRPSGVMSCHNASAADSRSAPRANLRAPCALLPSDLRATHGVAATGAGPVGSYPGGGGPFSEWYPGGNGGPDGSGAAYGSRILPGFEDSGAFVEMYPGGS